jgi:hypothetical protein
MRAISVALILLLFLAACGGVTEPNYPYPDTLSGYFAQEKLYKATSWFRDATSAAVYVREGQTMPGADLQIGIMVSYDKTTPEELGGWIAEQASRSEQSIFKDDDPEEACWVARSRETQRPYIALHSCKPGLGRAVCVQLDETYEEKRLSNCDQQCFRLACDQMWADWGEEIDWLIADVLERR